MFSERLEVSLVERLRGRGGSEPKKGVHSFLPAADDPPPGRSAVEIRSLYHYGVL